MFFWISLLGSVYFLFSGVSAWFNLLPETTFKVKYQRSFFLINDNFYYRYIFTVHKGDVRQKENTKQIS